MKKFFPYIALLLALLLLLGGCKSGEETAASPSPGTEAVLPYPQAEQVMPGDTEMFSVCGGTVTWQELYYWLVSSLEMTKEETGGLPGWDDMVQEMTFETFTKLDAAKAALLYRVVEQKAAELDVTLSAEDEESLAGLREEAITYFGSEEAYQAYLENNYLTEDLYTYFQKISSLYYGLFVGYFGENGEKCTDEDSIGVVENEGYILAKHILVETEAEAQELLSQLDAAGENYLTVFDELMQAHSIDPGLAAFPNGYLFTNGDMQEEFDTAARALAYNQYSGVVHSESGYHIILRLPIDPEWILDEGYTVRYYAASAMFENIVSQWAEEAEQQAVYTEAYTNLSLKEIFGE